jgi:hypothetical protein
LGMCLGYTWLSWHSWAYGLNWASGRWGRKSLERILKPNNRILQVPGKDGRPGK